MKSVHGNRRVWLGNYGFLGPTANPQKEIDAINTLMSSTGVIDSVYYFTAQDIGGGTPSGANDIRTGGIGQAWMQVCTGSSPTPSPSSCTPQGGDPYSSGSHISCCSGLTEKLDNWDG